MLSNFFKAILFVLCLTAGWFAKGLPGVVVGNAISQFFLFPIIYLLIHPYNAKAWRYDTGLLLLCCTIVLVGKWL